MLFRKLRQIGYKLMERLLLVENQSDLKIIMKIPSGGTMFILIVQRRVSLPQYFWIFPNAKKLKRRLYYTKKT